MSIDKSVQSKEGASTTSTAISQEIRQTSSAMDTSQDPPNRRQLERLLSRLTNDINVKEQELKTLLGHRSSSSSNAYVPGEITRLKEETKQFRRQRDQHRQTLTNCQNRIDELKNLLAAKRQKISELEAKYLWFRKEEKLLEQLQRYESLYANKRFANIREETAIVEQIDKLRRNQTQLKKWRFLCGERDVLETELKTLRIREKEIYNRSREARQNEQRCKDELNANKQVVSTKKHELDKLFNDKRRLIQDYNERSQVYSEWRRSHPTASATNLELRQPAVGGSRRQPALPKLKRKISGGNVGQNIGRHHMDDEDESDDECANEFELFVKEKRACKSLIGYLQRITPSAVLGVTLSSGSGENETSSHASLSKESSAEEPHGSNDAISDETHENLILLRKDGEEGGLNAATASGWTEVHGKRKACKKEKSRKANQSVSYDPQTLGLFDDVGVNAPLIVSDVPAAIENLKEKLKYFEDQTRLPPDSCGTYWHTTFGVPYNTDRMISSESEMTTDSARFSYITPSDADDSFSQTGLVSPDYASASVTSPRSRSLTFTLGGVEEEIGSAITPTTVGTSLVNTRMASIEESDLSKDVDEDAGLPRVLTNDEGFADTTTEVASSSKESSTDGTEKISGEIRQALENLAVGEEKE